MFISARRSPDPQDPVGAIVSLFEHHDTVMLGTARNHSHATSGTDVMPTSISVWTELLNHEAAVPNPALKPLGILVGQWSTIGTHPVLAEQLRARLTSIDTAPIAVAQRRLRHLGLVAGGRSE